MSINLEFTNGYGASLVRLSRLIEVGYITDFTKRNELFYNSVLLETLCHLHDLLQHLKASYKNLSVTFTDDITPLIGTGNNQYNDITSLITYCRNAACHIPTDKRKGYVKAELVSFVKVVGFEESIYTHLRCKYEDDAIVVFGDTYIYIKRHIVRAYQELLNSYKSIPAFNLFNELIKFNSNRQSMLRNISYIK
jgi:hypothetical protein